MPLRMAEYALGIYRLYRQLPRQIVLYVGEAKLRMASDWQTPHLQFRYSLLDIRELQSESFLASNTLDDNILALLAKLKNERDTVGAILEKIGKADHANRDAAIIKLLMLADLRRLGATINQELQSMPLLNSIWDHELIGPKLREGLLLGELTIVRRQIAKRFGKAPRWVEDRLATYTAADLELLADRILDAKRLEDIFI